MPSPTESTDGPDRIDTGAPDTTRYTNEPRSHDDRRDAEADADSRSAIVRSLERGSESSK
jgi:hypothetical protein